MRLVIITIEGVLAETPDLMTSPPTKLAKDFFNSLKVAYRVVLISNQDDSGLARSWLKKEGFRGWAMVMCYPENSAMGVNGWKVNNVRGLLGDGWDIAMVVDTDIHVQQAMLDEGVAAMMVSYPTMARPGKLPQNPGPVRAWGEIEASVEKANLLEQGG